MSNTKTKNSKTKRTNNKNKKRVSHATSPYTGKLTSTGKPYIGGTTGVTPIEDAKTIVKGAKKVYKWAKKKLTT